MSLPQTQTAVRPVLVAACGNVWAGDDAFGPTVAQLLRERSLSGVEVVDLGMKPAGLLDHLGDRTTVVIVDAAEPSSAFASDVLIDMDFMSPHRPALLHDAALSTHGLSIAHELALAQKLGQLPARVHLISAVATATELGEAMSATIQQLTSVAADRICALFATVPYEPPVRREEQVQ